MSKKEKYMKRLVVMHVLASDTHCSNNCPHMSLEAKECTSLGMDLQWDVAMRHHGNFRLDECKRLEIPVPR